MARDGEAVGPPRGGFRGVCFRSIGSRTSGRCSALQGAPPPGAPREDRPATPDADSNALARHMTPSKMPALGGDSDAPATRTLRLTKTGRAADEDGRFGEPAPRAWFACLFGFN